MILFPTLILSLIVTIGMVPLLKIFAVRFNALDMPNSRKVHITPMPRIGGVAMALGALVPILIWSPGHRFLGALLLGAAILVLFGLVDDIRGLSYRKKLAGQIAAAMIVTIYGGLTIDCIGDCLLEGMSIPKWLSIPLTLLAIVGSTNAINLSDGLDGLAGGISMMIFICLGVVAYQNDSTAIALLSVAVIGAIFGFLCFNSHPAKIFMGDAGSQLLGFLAAALAIYLSQTSAPLNRFFPLMLLGFPILDTLTVMVERLRKGESPFKADNNHFHHKLLRLGASHATAVVVIYTLQFVFVMSAFFLRFYSEWLVIITYLIISGAVIFALYGAIRHQWTVSLNVFFDKLVRRRPNFLPDRTLVIKFCYRLLEYAAPLILFISCLTLVTIPIWVGGIALALLAGLLFIRFTRRRWMPGMLWLTLFLMIPYMVPMAHNYMAALVAEGIQYGYHLTFGILVLLAVMTLKYTRRTKGFKANPFDSLIIFVSLLIISIPEIRNSVEDVSLIITKMIALFFAFEVLIGEARGSVTKVNFFIMLSLITVAVKSVA